MDTEIIMEDGVAVNSMGSSSSSGGPITTYDPKLIFNRPDDPMGLNKTKKVKKKKTAIGVSIEDAGKDMSYQKSNNSKSLRSIIPKRDPVKNILKRNNQL